MSGLPKYVCLERVEKLFCSCKIAGGAPQVSRKESGQGKRCSYLTHLLYRNHKQLQLASLWCVCLARLLRKLPIQQTPVDTKNR